MTAHIDIQIAHCKHALASAREQLKHRPDATTLALLHNSIEFYTGRLNALQREAETADCRKVGAR